MRLDSTVKNPRGEVTTEKLGLVLLNHGGSSIHHDTGREAQFYADYFGLRTIAANRSTSYRWPRDKNFRKMLDRDGVEAMMPLGEMISEAIISLGGIKKVILAGRSAAGLGVLELACTKTLPTACIYGAEPVASYSHDTKDALAYTRRYKKTEKAWVDSHPDPDERINNAKFLPLAARAGRFFSMATLMRTDVYYNRERWCRPETLARVEELLNSEETQNVKTFLEFAEHSYTAPNPAILEPFNQLVSQHPNQLSVGIVPDTYHCTFDRMTVFASRLRPVVDFALAAA